MHEREFKEGKSYRVTVNHQFEGEFLGLIEKGNETWAVFKTGGSGRYGEYTRNVLLTNIAASELVK